MAGINKRLGASTLVEVIVAALILMIVFAVTMETLVRFSVQDSEPIELTDAVTAVRTNPGDKFKILIPFIRYNSFLPSPSAKNSVNTLF